jgi:hypothetical protein
MPSYDSRLSFVCSISSRVTRGRPLARFEKETLKTAVEWLAGVLDQVGGTRDHNAIGVDLVRDDVADSLVTLMVATRYDEASEPCAGDFGKWQIGFGRATGANQRTRPSLQRLWQWLGDRERNACHTKEATKQRREVVPGVGE